jgi:hypothetical protein
MCPRNVSNQLFRGHFCICCSYGKCETAIFVGTLKNPSGKMSANWRETELPPPKNGTAAPNATVFYFKGHAADMSPKRIACGCALSRAEITS